MSRLETLYEQFYNNSDPRTSDWFLVSRPGSLIMILSLYVYFCVSAGPKYMSNRKPYTLRTTLIIYNLCQVLLSTYLVYEGLMAGWLFEYSYTCQPIDYSDNPSAMRMAGATYVYFVCKVMDLLDTVFFVLRKKERQISVLHLYHHTWMPIGAWIGVRYFSGGHGTFFGVLNSFVHIFVYGYYMLAAMGPKMQKYLWWKKYLTLFQIAQFFVVGVHSAQMWFTDCNYPRIPAFFIVLNSIVFLYMFGSFYVENHIKTKADGVEAEGASTNSRTSSKSD